MRSTEIWQATPTLKAGYAYQIKPTYATLLDSAAKTNVFMHRAVSDVGKSTGATIDGGKGSDQVLYTGRKTSYTIKGDGKGGATITQAGTQ